MEKESESLPLLVDPEFPGAGVENAPNEGIHPTVREVQSDPDFNSQSQQQVESQYSIYENPMLSSNRSVSYRPATAPPQPSVEPDSLGISTASSGSGIRRTSRPRSKMVTFASQLVENEPRSTPMAWPLSADGSVRSIQPDTSSYFKLAKGPVKIPCRYASCGCQLLVEKGTLMEQEHYQNCDFRPIPCLLEDLCSELIPYHSFVLHMMTHHIQPTYALNINTKILLWAQDFQHDQKWYPKWMCTTEDHFFFMMQRKSPGIWLAWVWMLGSRVQASKFKASIYLFKGIRYLGGTFPCHSIRETPEHIEATKNCLLFTDHSMLHLSQLGDNVVTDFSAYVKISNTSQEDYLAAVAASEADAPVSGQSSSNSLQSEYSADSMSTPGSSTSSVPLTPKVSVSQLTVNHQLEHQQQHHDHALTGTAHAHTHSHHRIEHPLIEDGSDFSLTSDNADTVPQPFHPTTTSAFEEVLKLFTGANLFGGQSSSTSTVEGLVDLDRELLYNYHEDDRLD